MYQVWCDEHRDAAPLPAMSGRSACGAGTAPGCPACGKRGEACRASGDAETASAGITEARNWASCPDGGPLLHPVRRPAQSWRPLLLHVRAARLRACRCQAECGVSSLWSAHRRIVFAFLIVVFGALIKARCMLCFRPCMVPLFSRASFRM